MLVNKNLIVVLFGVYICIIPLCVNSGYGQFVVGISDDESILDWFFNSIQVCLQVRLLLVM
jgi:hypothetical protein